MIYWLIKDRILREAQFFDIFIKFGIVFAEKLFRDLIDEVRVKLLVEHLVILEEI